MLYLSSQSTADGRTTITVTFALGTPRRRAGPGPEPRQHRVAATARRGAAAGRRHQQEHAGHPDGGAHLLARRLARSVVSVELHAAQHPRPAGQARWRRRSPLVRRARILDADLARSESDLRAGPDRRRGGAGASRPERAGRRRRAGSSTVDAQGAYEVGVQLLGRLTDPAQFGDVLIKSADEGRLVRVRDVGRIELGAVDYSTNAYLDDKPAVAVPVFQRPGSNALATARGAALMASLRPVSRKTRLRHHLQPVGVHCGVGARSSEDDLRGRDPRRRGRGPLPAVLARVSHSAGRDSCVARRHVRGAAGVRLLAEHALAVRPRPRDRHRRGRCDRGGGGRGAQSR